MKLNWNFLGGGGAKQKTFCGGSMDIFWNCKMKDKHEGANMTLNFMSLESASNLLKYT